MTAEPASDLEVGDIVELETTNLAHGGVFVARHGGRVVFVADAAPGEVVAARITENSHSRFLRAETLEVLRASPHRVPHLWSAASVDRAPEERAGGAELGHLELSYQRELKGGVLADALQRMAHLDWPVTVEPPDGERPDGAHWRTRVRLYVDAAGRPGPYAARSHRVVAVDQLPLATEEAVSAVSLTGPYPPGSALEVVAPSIGEPLVLVAEAAGAPGRRGAVRSGRRPQRGAASPGSRGRAQRSLPAARPDRAPREISERVGERRFALDARGFWQVHRRAPATLTRAVQELTDESLLDARAANLDLYGGVGLLAAALGDRLGRAARITTVESDERATDHAARNLAEWVGAAGVTDRVDRYLSRLLQTASAAERSRLSAGTVVLDPPRAGAGREVVDSLAELSPAQLVYVACDPIALARDTALLAGHGYALRELRAFDLFPHTHHLEAVARFTR